MLAVTSPSNVIEFPNPSVPVARPGQAEMVFSLRDGATRLDHLFQQTPLRVLFPDPLPGDPVTAALVTVSGGLVGGDHLRVDLTVGKGASALVHAQAAEKVYRSSGEDVIIGVDLSVSSEGWLEYLPQETILFDGARLNRTTRINYASGSRFLAGEILVFGRTARGETWATGKLHEGWEVYQNGLLIWSDALHLDQEISEIIANPFMFNGASAMASAVYGGPDVEQGLQLARDTLDGLNDGVQAAATLVNGLLVIRWLASDPLALRKSYSRVWMALRADLAGLPSALPRLWHV